MLTAIAGEAMSRQQAFEAIYAKQHDVPAESLVQYRHKSKDGYNLPGIASHYRTYCETLDSIVVELPRHRVSECGSPGMIPDDDGDFFYCDEVISSIHAAGVKYK